MNRTLAYLSFVSADRLLHTFRTNVGIASSAQPCGGWEDPGVELRGHSTGHLLTGLAQAYANTANSASTRPRATTWSTRWPPARPPSPSRGYRAGYLSAFPENFFDRLENGQTVWAPYYTIHKIMAGLLDQYLLAGNSPGAHRGHQHGRPGSRPAPTGSPPAPCRTCCAPSSAACRRCSPTCTRSAATPTTSTTARRFDHAQILDPLAAGTDQLAGFHANTQIPKALGAIREFHATGTTRYRDIAANFWDIVIADHTYVIGGNSNGEYFKAPDRIASELSDTTCEVCNTYNMLKLTRQLFFTNPARADYMDYYELALFNHILGEQDPNSSHGFVTYYTPLRAGASRPTATTTSTSPATTAPAWSRTPSSPTASTSTPARRCT